MESETNGSTTSVEPGRRRRRTGKKRLNFDPPQRFPRGVRDLWKSATAEEQVQAHQACTQILALWLGKRRREEVAAELSIPGLRVWQMSQQAIAGMLAGLLHQPRPRRRSLEATTMEARPDDPRVLKKKIAEQEKQIVDQQDLIKLLMAIPKPKSELTSVGEVPTSATKTRPARRRGKGEDRRGDVSVDAPAATRGAEADR